MPAVFDLFFILDCRRAFYTHVSGKRMTTARYINLGRLTALISFLLGTGIFVLYFLTSSFKLLFLGYGFIALTGLINIWILISILKKATRDIGNKSKLNWTAGLMLVNIPVMLIYCWFAIKLLDNMRITFTNATQGILTDIHIGGCEAEYIDKLEVGESKTVWVAIKGDCQISIVYLANGQPRSEEVAGYVTNGEGQKMKYNIGGQNEKFF
jgi:hypothetical protein